MDDFISEPMFARQVTKTLYLSKYIYIKNKQIKKSHISVYVEIATFIKLDVLFCLCRLCFARSVSQVLIT